MIISAEDVLAAAKDMAAKGLADGTEGNVSGRLEDGSVCITPSSIPYDVMTLDDLVVIDLEGQVVRGERGPSSEKSLHLACYRAYDHVGAVVHSHPTFASMFAVARQPIPAVIEEMVVFVGAEVPVCEYALTGSDELGVEATRHLDQASAALLANHGLVSVGVNPYSAMRVAALVEKVAKIVLGARALGGDRALPEETKRNFQAVYELLRTNPLP